MGIPVALSTDDRGMWDSNLTDEFFVAVKEFNLSWPELLLLSRNSLKYAFLDDNVKNSLLTEFENNIQTFTNDVKTNGIKNITQKPVSYSFICRHYQLCLNSMKAL